MCGPYGGLLVDRAVPARFGVFELSRSESAIHLLRGRGGGG